MKLRFTRQAIDDLNGLADYVRERNPQAAARVRDAILESMQNLVVFPRIGRRQDSEGVRKFVTRRYPYLVYYLVDDGRDEIVILTIQHPSRRRPHTDA